MRQAHSRDALRALLVLLLLVCPSFAQATNCRVRMASDRPAALLERLRLEGFATDCWSRELPGALELIVSDAELQRLRGLGLQPRVIERGRPFRDIQAQRQAGALDVVPPGYPDLAQVLGEMQQLAASYPAIARFVDLTATFGTPPTQEGRHLHALEISDAVHLDEDEPAALLVACHHSNEVVTPVLALDAMARLCAGYGSDPRITALVDAYEIWIVAVHNPDGYEHVFSADSNWRKNRRDNGDGTRGVDLNRNYPQGWSASCAGSSASSSSNYKGPAPASEPETQTLMALSLERRFAKVLDYHSWGRESLYAYNCSAHPFASFMRQEAMALSSAHGYGGSVRSPSAEGEHYEWQFATFGAWAHLTETATTIQPPYATAQSEAQLVWPGVLHFLERPVSVHGHVRDATTGNPLAARIALRATSFANGEGNASGGPHGRYHWTLPPGVHELVFEAPGYHPRSVQIQVTASSSQLLDVDLSPILPEMDFAFSAGLPQRIDPAGGTVLAFEVRAANGRTPAPGSASVLVDTGHGFEPAALIQRSANAYDALLPAGPCDTTVRYCVTALDGAGLLSSSPPGAPAAAVHEAVALSALSVHASDAFESPSGWTAGAPGDTAQTGIWNRMDPEGTAAQPEDDHTPAPGSLCWATDGRAGSGLGSYDVDGGTTTLLSPVYDLGAHPDARIRYWRWFSNHLGTNRDDVLTVDISSDAGRSWRNVETLGPLGIETEGGWFEHVFEVAGLLAPSAQTQLRFVAADTGGPSLVEAALDDLRIETALCSGELVRLGSGCPDSTGTPLRLGFAGTVHLGDSMRFSLARATSAPALLVMGASAASWSGLPLPLELGPYGAPGCWILASQDVSAGGLPPAGMLVIPLPPDPLLDGGVAFWQASLLDPALASPLPLATTDALRTRIGW